MIPVTLFAYNRPRELLRTLACLRENNVSTLLVYCDGPRSPDQIPGVTEVRDIIRSVDWCEVELHESHENLGLGRSILRGLEQVFQRHESTIVFEDDLVCHPGTCAYLGSALQYYSKDSRVMSVTGWTHPLLTPGNVGRSPYFDGRAECWVWGAWRRSWGGMGKTAMEQLALCRSSSVDPYHYGKDLVDMAFAEQRRNIWAVRFLLSHMAQEKLCLRPPWSMVDHIGTGETATNVKTTSWLDNPIAAASPPIPDEWPEPVENPECARLHRKMCGEKPGFLRRLLTPMAKRLGVG